MITSGIIILGIVVFFDRDMDWHAAVKGASSLVDGVIAEGFVVVVAETVQGQWREGATGA